VLITGQLEEIRADHQVAFKIEGPARSGAKFGMEGGFAGSRWKMSEGMALEFDRPGWADELAGAVFAGEEAGAEGFVARDDLVERFLEGGFVQGTAETEGGGYIIGAGADRDLIL
jgi:hypothetical protein